MPKMVEAQQQASNRAKVSPTSKDTTIPLKFVALLMSAEQFNVFNSDPFKILLALSHTVLSLEK